MSQSDCKNCKSKVLDIIIVKYKCENTFTSCLSSTGSVSVKNRKHRAAEVCLCLLCFLLLTAVIVLCVCFTSERKQLLTHISNLTEEREKTLTKYDQILNYNNNLTEEREQILTNNTKLLTENEHLLNKNKILTEESEQIKNKIEELQHGLYKQGNCVYSAAIIKNWSSVYHSRPYK